MTRYIYKVSAVLLFLSALVFGATAMAAKPDNPGGGGGGHKPPSGETASNHISFPVIFSDGVALSGEFTPSDELVFEPVLSDGAVPMPYYTEAVAGTKVRCVGESDIAPPETIAPDVLCYYGRLNLGLDEETGDHILVGAPRVWWLQQRAPNTWQALTLDVDPATSNGPVVVTGVDAGDLMESSTAIKSKQIRTEFAMYFDADGYTDANGTEFYAADTRFSGYVLDPFTSVLTAEKFQAFGMSGAVPGTDQSIAETQGTDYGVGPLGTQAMVDPTTIKVANNYFDPDATAPVGDVGTEAEEPGDPRIVALDPPIGMHAMVYSACARLLIQHFDADAELYWDSANGQWAATTGVVLNPVVDAAAWDGSYSAEINAGGGIIYGYNWNTKTFTNGPGNYRLTFVLEGDRCGETLNTVFDETTMSINVGERSPATLIPGNDAIFTAGEGGLVYVDVVIGTGGGGGNNR